MYTEIPEDSRNHALKNYNLGVGILNSAMKLSLSGVGENWDRARTLQSKMATNLKMAKERIAILSLNTGLYSKCIKNLEYNLQLYK